MNNTRRKAINKIIEKLELIKEDIESLTGEQQEYIDNIPENLLDGERAATGQEALDNLEYADLEEVITSLQTAVEG